MTSQNAMQVPQPLTAYNIKPLFNSVDAFLFDCDGMSARPKSFLLFVEIIIYVCYAFHYPIRCYLEGR